MIHGRSRRGSRALDRLRPRFCETVPALSFGSDADSADSHGRIQAAERAKDTLGRAGLQETLNFAFHEPGVARRFGISSSRADSSIRISEEYEIMVPSSASRA